MKIHFNMMLFQSLINEYKDYTNIYIYIYIDTNLNLYMLIKDK